MSSKEKIYSILYRLKEENELSPTNDFFVYKFTTSNFIGTCPTKGEEINILLKLKKEKIIKIIIPDELKEGIIRNKKSLLRSLKGIQIELLSDFDKYYRRCKKDISQGNKSQERWNYVNPFWCFWQLLILAWKHKIISGIITVVVGGLIVHYLCFKLGII
ncbi:hypothetical protein KAI65_00830 [Candidatus Parcubacteria bacterium]|nr:hypothetical protein [Candidatus Parcubacteria bacterium]